MLCLKEESGLIKKGLKISLLSGLLLFICGTGLFAKTDFRTGLYLRSRHEYWKNIFDFEESKKDNRNFFRVKSSVWAKADFNENTVAFVRLTNEFKKYVYFRQSDGSKRPAFDINEVVFDNLYLDLKNFMDLPVNLRLGRQDFLFTYGEGFLIMDGTPLDGSRTHYFNALKAGWKINEKHTLDLLYINDPRDDTFLPVINENKPPQPLNTTHEQAYSAYLKSKLNEKLYLESYYIYKIEDDKGGVKLQAEKGRINTLGGFGRYSFNPFAVRAQAAYEFGNYGLDDRRAAGGYVYLDYFLSRIPWSPETSIGYIYLSGDDPSTDKNEGWNPLFSRWPWMSELYSLSYNSESGLDYWTNLQMYRAELSLRPTKKSRLRL